MPDRILVTCEHGGKRVPREYRDLFRGHEQVLASHRGWDPGAEAIARRLAGLLGAIPRIARVTRLLVDLNRSPGHPRQFSEFTRRLPQRERKRVESRYYVPYRAEVERRVAEAVVQGFRVCHLSIHSFTPIWQGKARPLDLGLLYDPSRKAEHQLADRILRRVGEVVDWRIRRNQPYRGISDGFTTWLRRRFSPECYLGLELEFNQGTPVPPATRERVVKAVAEAVA